MMTKPRQHRWILIGGPPELWRCSRRGCGLLRRATTKSIDGWLYRRGWRYRRVPFLPVGLWVERQDVPRCAP